MYGKTSACASIDRSIVYMLSQIGNMDVLQGKMRGGLLLLGLFFPLSRASKSNAVGVQQQRWGAGAGLRSPPSLVVVSPLDFVPTAVILEPRTATPPSYHSQLNQPFLCSHETIFLI